MRQRSISRLLEWRWAPCAALALGSLAFVGLAIALIPDHLGGAPPPRELPVSVAPVATAPMPTAPMPTAPMPTAPMPTAPMPTAPMPTRAEPAPPAEPTLPVAAAPSSNPEMLPAPSRVAEAAAERHARRRYRQAGVPSEPLKDPVASFFPAAPPTPLPPPLPDTPPPPEPLAPDAAQP